MALPEGLRRVAAMMPGSPAAYTAGTGRVKVTKPAGDLGALEHSREVRGAHRPAQVRGDGGDGVKAAGPHPCPLSRIVG